VVFAAAVTAPNLYGAFLPEAAPTAYNFVEGFFAVVSTSVGVGWRINRHVAIGGALSYNYMLLRFAQKLSLADALRGPAPSARDAALADAAQRLIGDVRLDYEGTDAGGGWTLGVLLTPWSWLSLGIVYAGATPARFEGALALRGSGAVRDLGAVAPGLGLKLPHSLRIEMPIPHSLGWGLMARPARWLEIGFDCRMWFYQAYEEQVIEPLYDPAQPGREPLTRAGLSRRKDYGLTYEIGLGVLGRPWPGHPELELLAGVAFDKSPVPDETFSLDNPSMDTVLAAAGLRWRFARRWRVTANYMLLAYLPRDIRTSQSSPPVNARGEAMGHMPHLEVEVAF
jgi:long-subunit fatty acid transport protein